MSSAADSKISAPLFRLSEICLGNAGQLPALVNGLNYGGGHVNITIPPQSQKWLFAEGATFVLEADAHGHAMWMGQFAIGLSKTLDGAAIKFDFGRADREISGERFHFMPGEKVVLEVTSKDTLPDFIQRFELLQPLLLAPRADTAQP